MEKVTEDQRIKPRPYRTWGTSQKLMGDAIKLSKTRTEENERRRKNFVVNEDQVADVELVDDSKVKKDSEIVSIDVVAAVERRIM
ncbi:hypothetical protein KY285_030160 [Solanum tuberosum]|nr:hypothetical protein KY285_030160 [Solanum tuberosum]